MEIEVDIKKLKTFVEEKLPDILLKNTTDFSIAAFILQTLIDKINYIEELED